MEAKGLRAVRSFDLRGEAVEIRDARIVREYLDVTQQVRVTRRLVTRDDRADRNLGSSEIAIAPENGAVLRSVEIELEQHAVRIAEVFAPFACEERA